MTIGNFPVQILVKQFPHHRRIYLLGRFTTQMGCRNIKEPILNSKELHLLFDRIFQATFVPIIDTYLTWQTIK